MNSNDIMKIIEAMDCTSAACMKMQVETSDEYSKGFVDGQGAGIRWTLEIIKTLINK